MVMVISAALTGRGTRNIETSVTVMPSFRPALITVECIGFSFPKILGGNVCRRYVAFRGKVRQHDETPVSFPILQPGELRLADARVKKTWHLTHVW